MIGGRLTDPPDAFVVPDCVQMNEYKLTSWAIIGEDVFDYVEAHSIKVQSELKGFIKETCKLTSSIIYSHAHTRNSLFSKTLYQEQSILTHNTQT